MPGYSSISYGSTSGAAADMARTRRVRSSKDGGGGHASMISSCINLLNTIIGAGTLAMPAVMSHMGVMFGVFMIIWSGFTSSFGLYLQARCARYLDRGTSSFFALSQLTYPNAAIVFDTAIAIKCFGVGVSYMIIIGDLMPGVMKGLFGDQTIDAIPFLLDRNFWVTAFMLVIIPLAFLRRLDSLKYTSIIALISIGYLIILVLYHFVIEPLEDRTELRIIRWESPVAVLSNLPIVIFAYTCHQNMFSILNEIKDNSPASIVGVIAGSIGTAASTYILVAITGYLTFGNSIVGNIIQMYHSSAASTIGKAAIVILVTFSIPLQIHPCRASVDAILKWRPKSGGNSNSRSQSPSGGPLLPSSSSVASRDSHGVPTAPMSDMRFAIISTVIIILSYMTALTVSSLDRVLAYVGSTGSTSISFILPGLFYYKISDPDDVHHQRLTKEDDDAGSLSMDEADDEDASGDESGQAAAEEGMAASGMMASITSLQSAVSVASGRAITRWRRRFRWDMEHIEHGVLRKMALGLAGYGVLVMVVTLTMNTFFVTVAH